MIHVVDELKLSNQAEHVEPFQYRRILILMMMMMMMTMTMTMT